MLKNPKVTVRRNFVPQCECWDSVNLTQRGPWHPWEQVSKSPLPTAALPLHFWLPGGNSGTRYQSITLYTFIPEETKQIRPMACLSLHFHLMCHEPSWEFSVFPGVPALHNTAPQPNWWDWSQVLLRSYSFWNQEPKPTSSGSPVRGKALLSKVTTPPLHTAMRKEVEKSELKQPDVSNSINVTVHSLITEMVSHCSGTLGKTNRPELGFCQTGQLSNTRDWVMMNGNYLIR